MGKEKECECCHEWWYDSDVKESLCPNCYDYFKQLKRQLEEKDEQIKKRVMVYEKQFIEQTDEIYSLRRQLAEKQNTIDEINKEFVQAVHDWKTLCAEKDKEIERLKQELEETNAGYDFTYEQSLEAIKELKQNQTQLAIQELRGAEWNQLIKKKIFMQHLKKPRKNYKNCEVGNEKNSI